jgi:hypothetical protein
VKKGEGGFGAKEGEGKNKAGHRAGALHGSVKDFDGLICPQAGAS